MSSIIKLSVNNFISRIKIRLDFTVPVSKSTKKKKKKNRKFEQEGKKLGRSIEASKLGLVPRIPESQFSLGRNWLARRLETRESWTRACMKRGKGERERMKHAKLREPES